MTSAGDYRKPSTQVPMLVTFDRAVADQATEDITLLTYGTPELEALLPRATASE